MRSQLSTGTSLWVTVPPVRAYIENCCQTCSTESIEPGRAFDRVIGLDEVPDGYREMDAREAIEVMAKP